MQTQQQQQQNNRQRQYKIKNFLLDHPIGQGAFGTVYYTKNMESPESTRYPQVTATKQVKTSNMGESQLKAIKKEVEILKKLKSKNIVRHFKTFQAQDSQYIVMEFCNGGDLREQLIGNPKKRFSETNAVMYFKHIIEGFKAIEKQGIIHRDIKPENILLQDNMAKIADFGLGITQEALDKNFTFGGTLGYMSPQILKMEKYTSKTDVWSVGIMLYEMLYGKRPWRGSNPAEMLENIKSMPLTFSPKYYRTKEIKKLIENMLQIEEKNRHSWEQVFGSDTIQNSQQLLGYSSVIDASRLSPFIKSCNIKDDLKVVEPKLFDYDDISEGSQRQSSQRDLGKTRKEYLKIENIIEYFRFKINYCLFLSKVAFDYSQFLELQQELDIQTTVDLKKLMFYLALYSYLNWQIIFKALKDKENKMAQPEDWKSFQSKSKYKYFELKIKGQLSTSKQILERSYIGYQEECLQEKYSEHILNQHQIIMDYKQSHQQLELGVKRDIFKFLKFEIYYFMKLVYSRIPQMQIETLQNLTLLHRVVKVEEELDSIKSNQQLAHYDFGLIYDEVQLDMSGQKKRIEDLKDIVKIYYQKQKEVQQGKRQKVEKQS